jgi:hypothetical protein
VAATGALLLVLHQQPPSTGWSVTARQGTPLVDGRRIQARGTWPAGSSLTTDSTSTARLTLLGITIDVEENTTLEPATGETFSGALRPSIKDAGLTVQSGRLALLLTDSDRSARVFVRTPSSTIQAVAGEMSLVVDSTGTALLRVRSGRAEMGGDSWRSRLGAGTACLSRTESGVGTPYYEDATDAFRDALVAIDTAPVGGLVRRLAVDVLLHDARPRDSLTLWHLLERFEPALRGFVYDRVAELHPPPAGVTRAGIVAGDVAMLTAWGRALGVLPE